MKKNNHKSIMQSFEKYVITCALLMAHGKVNAAAQALGITRTSLWRKMKLYGLDKKDAKNV